MHEGRQLPPELRIAGFLVQPSLNRITGPNGTLQVEPRVLRVLLRLAARPGLVVPRDELLETVWNDVTVTDESLTRCISDLRRAFGDDPAQPAVIETIRKVGYRLIAPVELEPANGGPAAAPRPDSDPPSPAAIGRRAGDPPRGRGRARSAVALSLVSLVSLGVAAGALFWADRQREAAARERESSRQVTDFVIGLLGELDPDRGLRQGLEPRDILDRQAERVLRELEGEPAAQAALLQVIGRVYLKLGLYDRADPALERALELQRGGDRGPLATAATLESLAELRIAQGAWEEAVSLGREALAIRRRSLDPEDPLVARGEFVLADALRGAGAYGEAEALHRKVLEARRKRLGPRHREVAESLQSLAVVLAERSQTEAAEPLYAEAIAIWTALPGGQGDPEVAAALNDLGVLRLERGDPDGAEPPLREALAVRRRIYGDSHPRVAATMHNLADLLLGRGDLDAAESLIRETLEIRRRLLPPEHVALMKTRAVLAEVLRRRGDLEGAEPLLRENVERSRATLPDGHPSFGFVLVAFGRLLAENGEAAAAEPLLREGIEIHRRNLPPGHERIAGAEYVLGGCLLDLGRPEEAEEVLIGSLSPLLASGNHRSEDAQRALARLVELYRGWGRVEEADRYAALLDPPPRTIGRGAAAAPPPLRLAARARAPQGP